MDFSRKQTAEESRETRKEVRGVGGLEDLGLRNHRKGCLEA